MNKQMVIKLRDTLKNGKNYPLKVTVSDMQLNIDESNLMQFTAWDDTNGIIYVFRLLPPQAASVPNNVEQCINVIAVSYDYVQTMEVKRLPVADIESEVDKINTYGAGTISDNFKKRIKFTYENILSKDLWRLSPEDINNILGDAAKQAGVADAVNADDDYYAGKFTEPFQETHEVNKINEINKASHDEYKRTHP